MQTCCFCRLPFQSPKRIHPNIYMHYSPSFFKLFLNQHFCFSRWLCVCQGVYLIRRVIMYVMKERCCWSVIMHSWLSGIETKMRLWIRKLDTQLIKVNLCSTFCEKNGKCIVRYEHYVKQLGRAMFILKCVYIINAKMILCIVCLRGGASFL